MAVGMKIGRHIFELIRRNIWQDLVSKLFLISIEMEIAKDDDL